MPYRIVDLPIFSGLPTGQELAEISNAGTKSSQIAIAELAYGRQANNITVGGSYNLSATNYGDVLVNVNSAVTVNLPSATLRSGVPVSVVDIGGHGAAHNITLAPAGAETIMGQPSIAITGNYGGFTLWPIITGGWYQK